MKQILKKSLTLENSMRIGDRSTSDVVVRLRTHDGRDDWIYCHSHILTEKSKYFADRLSENWPTCQILDSRNCVEVYCDESDFDHHVTILRLFYVCMDTTDMWSNSVQNSLCILRVAVHLGCPQISAACVAHLEAVPWEEAEEEEILKLIPTMGLGLGLGLGLGSQAQPILARLQPVNPTAILKIFLAALQFATSSPPPPMTDLKTSAQEQLEYMLTEDDDAPLLSVDDQIKLQVRECIKRLLARFNNLIEVLLCDPKQSDMLSFQSYLSDLSWACQISAKLEIMREIVSRWMEASEKLVKVAEQAEMLETKLKVIEVTTKVLEAICYGSVILPTAKRLHMVKIWFPFVRVVKPMIDDCEDGVIHKVDGDLWQSLESAFVSIILTLPSGEQADILSGWLRSKHSRYPDLTEAFEVWCYRSKVANKRLPMISGMVKML